MRALLALFIVAVPRIAAADFECTMDAPACIVSARFESRTIPYVVRQPPPDSELTEAELVAAITDAFEVWSSVECTSLNFLFQGVIAADAPTDVPNEIVVVTEGWPPERALALARTRVNFNPVSGSIETAVILINDEIHTFGDVENLASCSGINDLRTILVHEVGHFIGIAHPCELDSATCDDEPKCPKPACPSADDLRLMRSELTSMWPEIQPCETFAKSLAKDDVLAVCTIYPLAGPSRACSSLRTTEDELVGNAAFGCSASGGAHKSTGWWWFGVVLVVLRSRKRCRVA